MSVQHIFHSFPATSVCLPMWMAFLLTVFTACSDTVMEDEKLSSFEQPISALFQIRIHTENSFPGSRAGVNEPNNQEDESIGHSIERTVNKVSLFAVPLQGDVEQWDKAVCGSTNVFRTFNNQTPFLVTIPINLIVSGKMHLYVGANLSHAQESAFIQTTGQHHYITSLPYYYQAINDFAPFGNQNDSFKRSSQDIVMFCRQPLEVNVTAAQLKLSTIQKPIEVPGTSELKRMVAKVLLTCQTKPGSSAGQMDVDGNEIIAPGGEEGVDYVETRRDLQQVPESNAGHGLKAMGWIRQNDVHYFINSMTRMTYFLQQYKKHTDGTLTNQVEPTYNLKEGMIKGQLGSFNPLAFAENKVNKYYIHYTMLEMHQRNQSFQRSSVWNATEYDKLIAGTEPSAYNQPGVGMYTLENMFEVKENDFNADQMFQLWNYGALPIVTHVAIAVKFTPRYLWASAAEWDGNSLGVNNTLTISEQLKKDFNTQNLDGLVQVHRQQGQNQQPYVYLTCANEKVAQAILTHSLKYHGHYTAQAFDPNQKHQYPEHTFFVFTAHNENALNVRHSYCTYGGASLGNQSAGGQNIPYQEMTPFVKGRSYYYTYVNNEEEASVTELRQACIERNHYYILRLNNVGSLGVSISDPKFIKVHTLKADWKTGGQGQIELN